MRGNCHLCLGTMTGQDVLGAPQIILSRSMHYKNVKISVVIPSYNRERLIKRAVESALNQTVPPDEIIVVDDGSQDNTQGVLEPLREKVQYISQKNSGSAVARDRGIRAAKGRWVALLDSDDVWARRHLERMAKAIATTNGEANYYFADTIHPPNRGGGSRWHAVGFHMQKKISFVEDGTDWVLINPQPMMLQSSVFSKAAYVASGGFLPQLRFRDDTHIFFKLGLSSPVCAVAGVGAKMTSDDESDARLTLAYGGAKLEMGHQMQVWMFSDLLTSLPILHSKARQEIERRLVGAHYSLARDAWHQKKFLLTCHRLARSYLLKFKYSLGSR